MAKPKNKEKKSSSELSDLIMISQIIKQNARLGSLVAKRNEMQELHAKAAELGKIIDLQEKLIEAGGEGSVYSQKSEIDEQLRAKQRELNTLKQRFSVYEWQINGNCEIRGLEQKNCEMEEKEASEKVNALTAQVENLQKDFLTLPKTVENFEHYCKKIKEEHAEALAVVRNEKNELANENKKLQRTLKERDDAYQKLNEKYKKVDSRFNECKVKLEVADRKMEVMAKGFRQGIQSKDQKVADLEHQVEDLKRGLKEKGDENNTLLGNIENLGVRIRMSNQKLRGTEKSLREKEESFKRADEKFEQDQRALEDRIAAVVAAVTADNEAFREIIVSIEECVNSVLSGIDTVSRKFSDESQNHENIISNISHELQGAKEHVSKMNMEKGMLEKDKNHLLEELQGKLEKELTLTEKVEKLEAKAKEEESEKMNLNATVVELKKTVEELEKLIKEKEECMGEEKRHTIRQLCLCIDYHRERNDYLKKIILKTRRG